jgi:hypothetical protein
LNATRGPNALQENGYGSGRRGCSCNAGNWNAESQGKFDISWKNRHTGQT